MCVIYFALHSHSDHPLILLANRDEFYRRPTQAAGYWNDFPDIYGGRDLQGGGTWLGVTRGGRLAAVTNYRDPTAPTGTRSRGDLVAGFLQSDLAAADYLKDVHTRSGEYSGFNLLVGEFSTARSELYYYSTRGEEPRELHPGIYGLSNSLLDTPWPKVTKGKAQLAVLSQKGETSNDDLFDILSDEAVADDEDLPSTGVPYEAEKAISAIYIKTPDYGTRCSTILRFDRNFKWKLEERVFV